jgi:hypothetical protein
MRPLPEPSPTDGLASPTAARLRPQPTPPPEPKKIRKAEKVGEGYWVVTVVDPEGRSETRRLDAFDAERFPSAHDMMGSLAVSAASELLRVRNALIAEG